MRSRKLNLMDFNPYCVSKCMFDGFKDFNKPSIKSVAYFFTCNIKICVYFEINFVTYSKSDKTCLIRSNFSIKQS